LDKGLLGFIAVGAIAVYFVTGFVDKIQDDDGYNKSGYIEKNRDKDIQYQTLNSVGDRVLDLSLINEKKQITVWNRSEIKDEFLTIFPNFLDMKEFIKERVVGDDLQKRLIETIESIEERFIAGEISVDEGKREFNLKIK
jgi:hypothetical protein